MPLLYEDLKRDQLANPPQYDQQGMLIRRYTQPAEAPLGAPQGQVLGASIVAGQNSALSTGGSTVRRNLPPVSSIPTYEEFIAQRGGNLDETAVRENVRKSMQTEIDAINSVTADLLAREDQAGQARLDKVRAININSGLGGSNFGSSRDIEQRKLNEQSRGAIQNQQDLLIQNVTSRIDKTAREEIQAKKAEALGNAEAYSTFLKGKREEVRSDLSAMAKAGMSLDDLDEQRRNYLLKRGFDDPVLGELWYESQKPKASKIDYKAEKAADGKILLYGVDPATGQLKTQRVNFDMPEGYEPTYVDGQMYFKNSQTGDLIPAPMDDTLYTQDYKNYLLSKKEGYGGNFEQWQTTDANRKRSVSNTTINYGGLSKEEFNRINAISDDVRQDPDIKNFIEIRDGYERVQTGSQQNNAQGDLALLFGYMKLLDPTSVVRETEFANAQAAMGYAQRILNIPAQFLRGERLTDEGRAQFAASAKELYRRKEQSYKKAVDYYQGRAEKAGIDPSQVLRDFGTTVGGQEDQVAELKAQGYSDEQIKQLMNTP